MLKISTSRIENHLCQLGYVNQSLWCLSSTEVKQKKPFLTIFPHVIFYLNVTKNIPFKNKLWQAMKSGYFAVTWNRRDRGAANEPPPAAPKAGLHAGKAVCVCGVSPLLWAPSKHQMIHSSKHCSRLDQMKALLDRKHPELVNRKHRIFHQDKARPRVSLTTRQKLSQPGWEVLSHPPCSPDTAPSVSHLFRSSQNSVNGRNLNSLEDCRDTWNSFLLKKIKSFGKMEVWSCPKDDRR